MLLLLPPAPAELTLRSLLSTLCVSVHPLAQSFSLDVPAHTLGHHAATTPQNERLQEQWREKRKTIRPRLVEQRLEFGLP